MKPLALLPLALVACSEPSPAEPAPKGNPPPAETPAAAAKREAAPRAANAEPVAAASCKLTAPAAFAGRSVKWEGECSGGAAHGRGVLRGYPKPGSGDENVWLFFGTLERGEPTIGVIETPDGFMAGEFAGGTLRDNDDPNVTLRAFRAAHTAAELVSKRFEAAGNAPSAAFYADKARSLSQQMN